MTIPATNLHPLANASVRDARLRDLIGVLEGDVPTPYLDTASPPKITIGIGFNIDASGPRAAVYAAMGLTAAEQAAVDTARNSAAMTSIRNMPADILAPPALPTSPTGASTWRKCSKKRSRCSA